MQNLKHISLRSTSLPKKFGELMHSNQFLKVFAVSALALVFAILIAFIILVTKEPTVITLNGDGKNLEKVALPKPEYQVQEGIKYYLEKRYQWEPETVVQKLKESEEFIAPKARRAFQGAVSNVAKFSVDKIVSQRIYPNEIKIDFNNQTALVTGDRITSIQGLKAAGNLKLELTFESGPRTTENPWGLYISKEREE